ILISYFSGMMEVDTFKRPSLPGAPTNAKRGRFESNALVSAVPQQTHERTSNMQAPIMLLNGHEGEIYTARFSPDGQSIASAGFDQNILLWNVYGECDNYSTLKGHTGAIMDVHWSTDSDNLFSCATDKMVRVWDMATGQCIRKMRGHNDIVNSLHPARRGPQLICTASDDGTVKVFDTRRKEAVKSYDCNGFQQTAVTFNDTAEQVISGSIDNDIRVFDLRRDDIAYVLRGHTDTITGLALSPDGSHLLSNSMDCSARMWDVRPYAPAERCTRVFLGHQHNFEKNLLKCAWSADSYRVSCGSSDRYVYVWEVSSKKIIYKLPGHQGSVNAVDFHPKEPILLSAGSDKKIYLGELDA
ncbi:hypothetical protein PENTCL1PPCAC_27328, partial [Pristionchus entomophagus]